MDYAIVDVPLANQIRRIQDNHYHLSHLIGKGGFGEVYSARRVPDGQSNSFLKIEMTSF